MIIYRGIFLISYFYASDSAAARKLTKMDAQVKRLGQKRRRLRELEGRKVEEHHPSTTTVVHVERQRAEDSKAGVCRSVPFLKAEYEAIVQDARSEYFKQLFGRKTLSALRVSPLHWRRCCPMNVFNKIWCINAL